MSVSKTKLIKSNIKPNIYRSLSLINKQLFPVVYNKKVSDYDFFNTVKAMVYTGMNSSEFEQKLYEAIVGSDNELKQYLGGTSIPDDNVEKVFIVLIIMGVIIGLVAFKILYIFQKQS